MRMRNVISLLNYGSYWIMHCHTDVPTLFLSTHSDDWSLVFRLDASVNWPECFVCTWALVPRKNNGC